ncbi:hypothetical protein CAEBREN_17746 [Caenorhabditis brenneri]|uniref:Peptidase M13 C-terminal domain-containing protein n=1 Tax=Caenorhabditis brenneri TaxID=135651 RepID=G0NQI0_CAEBE|nr:hypothetical protein CAEBREN_17746 [Caenorhabditis brenneri]
MFFQMLAAPLYDSEYPLAVQYGRAGHDVAVSMAIELENVIHMHPKCAGSDLTEYLAMRAAWNGFQSATKSKGNRKLPGLETIPDEQIFFYSMVQSKCQEEDGNQGRRVNNVLKEMKEFRETFGCSLVEKSANCEPLF